MRTRGNRYGIPERMNVLKGRIQGNAKGFAFLIPEEPEFSDVYIAESDLNGAFHGDKVLSGLTVRPPRRAGGRRGYPYFNRGK